jgi:predicted RNA-binding Zn-ribbon protein involved in translation (DUF1610 family)
MSIFDFLKTQNPSQKAEVPQEFKDERKAECPSCSGVLKRAPGAKTKCPHCGEFMFVRTTPDNVRIVVTKNEADEIDERWRIENGTQEAYLVEQKRNQDRKEALRKRFGGKEPSEHDVQWSLLNEEILNTASNAQWGLYRNVRFQMAEILNKENKLKDALRMYLGVCYLDLNGASNMPTDEYGNIIEDPEFFKPFDPELKFFAPGVIDRIQQILKKLEIRRAEVRTIFVDFGNKEQKATRAPIAPENCFEELAAEIWESS